LIKIRFIASLVIANFRIRITLAVDYTEAAVEWEQWAVEDPDSDTGENSEASGIRELCKAAQNHDQLLTR